MAWKTVYKPPKKVKSVSGEKDRSDYKPHYLDGDSYELLESGKIHSYDEIQSHAAECDMNKIIEMYQKTGDEKILQRRAGFYDEAGVLPSDYVALSNSLKKADTLFNGLPVEIREKYGNSPAKFFSSPNNMAVIDGYYKQKAAAAVTPKVSPDTPKPLDVKVGESNEQK